MLPFRKATFQSGNGTNFPNSATDNEVPEGSVLRSSAGPW